MSDFFGMNVQGLIDSIGGALGALAPAPPQGSTFAPSADQGGSFQPAPAVAGSNLWPTVTMGGEGLQPAQLQLGTFQPSGGNYGGFAPSSQGYGGFAPSPGAGGSPFQPTPFNPLTFDPNRKPAATPGTPGATGTATYTGVKPEVAQWAGQVQATFGKYGGYVSDAMLAIIMHESEGNPGAYNGAAAGGAWGLFQQMNLGNKSPAEQFAAAEGLLKEKLATTAAAYARLGINPDDKTRARDLFLAWAGQFDPATAGPSSARDVGSGEDGNAFLYGPRGIMPMYESIVRGKQQAGNAGGLVQRAQTLIGTPYAVGGLRSHPNNPQAGLDCSEYTAWIYQGQGVNLPWNAQQQYNATGRVQNPNELQVGDLVFFQGTNAADPDTVTHVGMYIGNGQFINSQDGGVKVANLNDSYWQRHYYGGGRVTTL